MKNVTTPRTLSDAQFVTGYQSIRNSSKRTGGSWFAWAGWIAFGLLLLSTAVAR